MYDSLVSAPSSLENTRFRTTAELSGAHRVRPKVYACRNGSFHKSGAPEINPKWYVGLWLSGHSTRALRFMETRNGLRLFASLALSQLVAAL